MIQLASSDEPPAARNGVVRPGERNEPGDAADHDEALQRNGEGEPGGQQLPERVPGAERRAEAPGEEQQVHQDDREETNQAQFLAERGNDHVAVGEGNQIGASLAEAGADESAVRHAEQPFDDLQAAAELPSVDLVGERVDPAVNPQRDVGEDAGGDESADSDEPDADDHPADAARGDVDHHEEKAEEQDRGAQVPLEDQHADAHEPGGEHWAHVLEPRELDGSDLPAGQQDEVPVGGKIPGEEYGERDLGDFTGLEGHGAELDPDPRAQDFTGRYAGNQRQDQQDRTDGEGNIGETAEDPVVLEEPDDGDRDSHRHQGPAQLVVARVFPDPVQPVDHRQSEAVEGHHQRKYYRIGIFCPEAQHDVEREGGCGEQARLEPEIGIESLLLVHARPGRWRRCRRRGPAPAGPVRYCAAAWEWDRWVSLAHLADRSGRATVWQCRPRRGSPWHPGSLSRWAWRGSGRE